MKELRDELFSKLCEELQSLDFRCRKTYRNFLRDMGNCSQLFHISFINHVFDFDVTADVSIRHHSVEEIMNLKNHYLKDSEKKRTATIGANLGNISGVGQIRWTVADKDDISVAVDEIVDYFKEVGLPFLERFSSLDETYKVLSADGKEASLICPFPENKDKSYASNRLAFSRQRQLTGRDTSKRIGV